MRELISIIVPMYNEEEMVDLFFDTIIPILKSIKNYDYEIVAVNDGSKDKTLELLKEKQKTVEELVIVDFTRNFGHEAAVSAGLKNASGDVLIPLDADLQDPPSLIPELIKKYEEGYEVIDAKRGSRKDDTFMKRTTAKMFYSLINKISDIDVPNNVGHYRLITRKVADAVNALPEKSRVFRVEVPYVGFKTTEIEFVRPKRAGGQGHYNYKRMFDLAFDSITSTTVKPLRLALPFTIGLFLLSFFSYLTQLVIYLVDINVASFEINYVINWLWLIGSTCALFLAILFAIVWIRNIYVERMFINAQDRPLFVVREVIKRK